jgi:hypothetical protein
LKQDSITPGGARRGGNGDSRSSDRLPILILQS